MSWKVRVEETNYGQQAVVFITRRPFSRFHHNGIRIATLDLTRDDAEEQMAEARAKALSLLVGVGMLEST